jgi:organic hydroperoxide reductase OsmC/OhrA
MADNFNIFLWSGEYTENPRKRIHSIINPINSSLPELTFQLPITYEGPEGIEGEKKYTPEDYFLAAISGCFFTTFSVVCSNSNFNYKKLEINSTGYVGTSTGIKMMEKIEQDIKLTIPKTLSQKKAKKILEMTEKRCPLAQSIKTEVKNTYHIFSE